MMLRYDRTHLLIFYCRRVRKINVVCLFEVSYIHNCALNCVGSNGCNALLSAHNAPRILIVELQDTCKKQPIREK